MLLGIAAAVGFVVVVAVIVVMIRGDAPEEDASPPGSDDMTAIRRLVERNELIPAIKLYRKMTGQGLRESKEAVERFAATGSFPAPPPIAPAPNPEAGMEAVRQALREDKLIMAIKHCREATGLGLKEAKDAVETMRDEMRRRGEIP